MGRSHHIKADRIIRETVMDLSALVVGLRLVKNEIEGISPEEAGELLEEMKGVIPVINRLKSQLKELGDEAKAEDAA